LRHQERPINIVLALRVCATEWLSVFVLLLDGTDLRVADLAGEVANQKLWLYFGGARNCALNRHHFAE
jgi:hypothetical protein